MGSRSGELPGQSALLYLPTNFVVVISWNTATSLLHTLSIPLTLQSQMKFRD